MQENYLKVPNIITGKDLDYLSDVFQWNYDGVKSMNEALSQVDDQEIIDVIQKALNLFDESINSVLNILSSEGGDSNE